ncbi:MAG: hypothetical protein PHF31_08195 [Methylobacter sp.]|nr:hypothetical protein [Methylobacter sp.]
MLIIHVLRLGAIYGLVPIVWLKAASISIGDGATLLPGTVFSKSIPAGVVTQGNPVQLVLQNLGNSGLHERQDVDAIHTAKSNGRNQTIFVR